MGFIPQGSLTFRQTPTLVVQLHQTFSSQVLCARMMYGTEIWLAGKYLYPLSMFDSLPGHISIFHSVATSRAQVGRACEPNSL
jgi:hypothetical protein